MRPPRLFLGALVSPRAGLTRHLGGPPAVELDSPPSRSLEITITSPSPKARRHLLMHVASAIGPPLGVAGVAGALRIAFPDRPDIFLDEVNYVDLASSVRHGHYPPSFLHEGPFLLHPPLFFLLAGFWQSLTHPSNYFALINSTRLFVSFFAIATAVASYAIVQLLMGKVPGVIAGVVFGVEPYALRENAHVFLETPSMCLVLWGYYLLMTVASRRTRSLSGDEKSTVVISRLLGAGALLGLAGVTLEITALITVLPLMVLLVTRWCLPRGRLLLVLVGLSVPYAIYLASLAMTHTLHAFYVQDLLGLKRALGVLRITGFTSAAGSPSLTKVLLNQLKTFATTYALVALSAPSAIYLLLVKDERLKLCGLLVACGGLMIAYDGLIGTIEEQFLYVLLVPGILALVLAGSDLASRPHRRDIARGIRALLVAAVLGIVSYDLVVATWVRATPDNGVTRLAKFFRRVDHRDQTVSSNTQVVIDVLRTQGVNAVTATSTRLAAADKVHYLAVLSAELVGSYGSLRPSQVQWYAHHARVVLSFKEPTYGTVTVYATTNAAAW